MPGSHRSTSPHALKLSGQTFGLLINLFGPAASARNASFSMPSSTRSARKAITVARDALKPFSDARIRDSDITVEIDSPVKEAMSDSS